MRRWKKCSSFAVAAAALLIAGGCSRWGTHQPAGTVWVRHFPGSLGAAVAATSDGDVLYQTHLGGGGVTLDGQTFSGPGESFTFRLGGADGRLRWARQGEGAVAVTGGALFVLTARVSTTPTENGSLVLTKRSLASGDELWAKTWPPGRLTAAALAGGGNALAIWSAGAGRPTLALLRGDDGSVIWIRDDVTAIAGATVAMAGDGDPYLAADDGGTGELTVIRCARADGSRLWSTPVPVVSTALGRPGPQRGTGLRARAGGGVYLTTTAFPEASKSSEEIFVAAVGGGGSIEWARRYGESRLDIVGGVDVDPHGDAVISGAFVDGYTRLGSWTLRDGAVFLARLAAADGAVIWADQFSPADDQNTGTASVAADATGRLYVGGYGFAAAVEPP